MFCWSVIRLFVHKNDFAESQSWRTEAPRDDADEPLSIECYMDALRAQGWTLIGDAGGFARVFERESCVSKVVRKDPAYLSYVRHVLGAPEIERCRVSTRSSKLQATASDFIISSWSVWMTSRASAWTTLEEIRALAYRIAVAEATAPGSAVLTETDEQILVAMTEDEQAAPETASRKNAGTRH